MLRLCECFRIIFRYENWCDFVPCDSCLADPFCLNSGNVTWFCLAPSCKLKIRIRVNRKLWKWRDNIEMCKKKTMRKIERENRWENGKLAHLSTASFASLVMLSIGRSTDIHVHLVIDLLLMYKQTWFYFLRSIFLLRCLHFAWLAYYVINLILFLKDLLV